jgi:hypothetical protein
MKLMYSNSRWLLARWFDIRPLLTLTFNLQKIKKSTLTHYNCGILTQTNVNVLNHGKLSMSITLTFTRSLMINSLSCSKNSLLFCSLKFSNRQHRRPSALESYHNPIHSALHVLHTHCKIILPPKLSFPGNCLNTASHNFVHYMYYASHTKLSIK